MPLSTFEPGTTQGALAAECAADQDAFWPYHDRLFVATSTQGQAGFLPERLIEYAEELGLDVGEFTPCLINQIHRDTIQEVIQKAVNDDINSTPTLVVNGQKMANAFDYDALSAEIDRLLDEANN